MLEEKPVGTITFPPPEAGDRYRVKTGDSWDSIAAANSLTVWGLIEHNFPIVKGIPDFQRKCRMVNWLLKQYVGCTQTSDGKNYRFDSRDTPGYIYIPLYDQPPAYTHRVRLHFRSLSLTDIPFDRIFRWVQRSYAPHGIRMDFASGMSLGLPEADAQRLATVNGQCEWTITDGEFAEIQRLGPPAPATDIVVYFVSKFEKATLTGCGGHLARRPACLVASNLGNSSTAHEIGHVLLGSSFRPVHDPSNSNLMYATKDRLGDPPALNAAQVTQMKTSVCCHSI